MTWLDALHAIEKLLEPGRARERLPELFRSANLFTTPFSPEAPSQAELIRRRIALARLLLTAMARPAARLMAGGLLGMDLRDYLKSWGAKAIPEVIPTLLAALRRAQRADLEQARRAGYYLTVVDEVSIIQVLMFHLLDFPDQADAIAKKLLEEPWTDDMRWIFLQAVKFHAAALGPRDGQESLVSRFENAPLLVRLAGSTKPIAKLPRALPLTMKGAFELYEHLGLGAKDCPSGAPATAKAMAAAEKKLGRKLPVEVRELYAKCDGLGPIPELRRLPKLQEDLQDTLDFHERNVALGEPAAKGRSDIRHLSPIETLFAFGDLGDGDLLFLDLKASTAKKTIPVLRLVHDRCFAFEPERISLGAYVAALFVEAWAEKEGAHRKITKLIAKRPFRITP